MASNMANLLMQYGAELPNIIKSNRKTANDLETEKLRQALLQGQITESQLGSAFKQKQIDAADIANQSAVEEGQRKRQAREAMASALGSYVSSKRTTGMAQDIAELEKNAGLTPLASEKGFDKPMSMRETAESAGVPKFAGNEDVKQFTSDYITAPEKTEADIANKEAVLQAKYDQMASKEKMFDEKMSMAEKLADAKKIAEEAKTAAKEDKKKKETENKYLIQIDKTLRNDYLVKQRSEQLQYAANTLALLHSDNPVANQAAKTQLARLAGEVGVLTDRDVERFGGSKALLSKLNQAIAETTTGKLSKENKAFLTDVADSFYKAAQNSLNDRLDIIAAGQSEAFNVPIDRIKPLVAAYSSKPYSKDEDKKITEPTVNQGSSTSPIRLQGDKAKRLEELRRKQAEGTLK